MGAQKGMVSSIPPWFHIELVWSFCPEGSRDSVCSEDLRCHCCYFWLRICSALMKSQWLCCSRQYLNILPVQCTGNTTPHRDSACQNALYSFLAKSNGWAGSLVNHTLSRFYPSAAQLPFVGHVVVVLLYCIVMLYFSF